MIHITLNRESFDKGFERMKHTIPKELELETERHAEDILKSLQFGFIINQKKAPRINTAERMRIKKLGLSRHGVLIPKTADYIDNMTPHYVSVRKHRVREWVRRYFDGRKVSGKSRVKFTDRGGITGVLYVTPDPFITDSLDRARPFLKPRLYQGITRALRGAFQ
jgi:hypothetical protein